MSYQTFASSNIYNELPSVEQAHKLTLRTPNFNSIINEVGKVLENHDLHNIVGIALIHRHNYLSNGEIMVQRIETLKSREVALVTSKERAEEVLEDLYPAVWRCTANGEVGPLEYCPASSISKLPLDFFSRNREVFSEIASIYAHHGLEHALGLSLLHHGVLNDDKEEYVRIENIDAIRVANIVTLARRDENILSITTSWTYCGAEQQRCIPFAQCVPRSPGHDVTPGHEFVEGE